VSHSAGADMSRITCAAPRPSVQPLGFRLSPHADDTFSATIMSDSRDHAQPGRRECLSDESLGYPHSHAENRSGWKREQKLVRPGGEEVQDLRPLVRRILSVLGCRLITIRFIASKTSSASFARDYRRRISSISISSRYICGTERNRPTRSCQ
jgi:hypothetical protein